MGLESYRLGIKFKNMPKIEDVLNILDKLGGIMISQELDNKEIEFVFQEGIIEMLIYAIEDGNKIVEQITGNKCTSIKVNERDLGKTVIELRFAKPNSIELVDKLIELLKKLDKYLPIEFIGDIESKHEINLENYEDLKLRVQTSQNEFNKWFSIIPYPVRCIDVFKRIREIESNNKQT